MKVDKHITEVQFRVLNGVVLAVMPYIIDGHHTVLSYAHIGQHGGANCNINTFTKKASPEQYKSLLNELKSLGYNVQVIERRNHSKYLKAYHKAQVK